MCSTCKSTGDGTADMREQRQASASSSLNVADDILTVTLQVSKREEKQEEVLKSRRVLALRR
jgi:hypothetical protein